ncbi:Uncharacterised protein [Mycobacteroides abscessus subsp. abscessus]|nr:Uncharacterised protein [Mycobacteroides abscessus subsp. abscessus]
MFATSDAEHQLCNGRSVEHGAFFQSCVHGPVEGSDETHRQQRIATQIEE